MKINNRNELQELTALVSEMSLLRYFPSEPSALTALVRDIANMVNSMNEVRWLVTRMRQLYNDWPGPRELRAVYCYDHFPADGVKAYSEQYPNGFPSTRDVIPPERQIWSGPMTRPEPWTDEELAEAQRYLDEAVQKRRRERQALLTPAIDAEDFNRLMAQIKPGEQKPITQADVDAIRADAEEAAKNGAR